MFQTGYKGYTTLAKGLPYMGGFCRWYYVDRAQLVSFPAVDPATQYLSAEPPIIGAWCGPVMVPNDQLGFEETPKRDGAGLYFQHKVAGFHPGDNAASRINQENMHWYEFLVVGKLRAGGMHLLLGSAEHGLQFDATYTSTGKAAAGSSFTFTGNLLNKGFVLPAFAGTNLIPAADAAAGAGGNTGGGLTDSNYSQQQETFFYTSEDRIQIEWNAARLARFGAFPVIEVWYTEGGNLRLNNAPVITVDQAPPLTTLFTITINTPGPGFILIK